MKLYLLAFMLVFSFGSAHAANWIEIGGADQMLLFVDVDSISVAPNGKRKAWASHNYLEPQLTGHIPPKKFIVALHLSLFDCAEKTSATVQEVLYEDATKQKQSGYLNFPKDHQDFRDAVPGSIGETTLKFVCSAKISSKKK